LSKKTYKTGIGRARALDCWLHYAAKDKPLNRPDAQIVFAYHVSNLENSQPAK